MELERKLRERFGDSVSIAIDRIRPGADRELLPAEANDIAKAVPARRFEYATGRLLARRLLDGLGVPSWPLLRKPDRTPAWPEGVVGSISHTAEICIVVAAPTTVARSIAIDAEPRKALDLDVWDVVMSDRERASLGGREDAPLVAKRYFSAKETIHKLLFPMSKLILEFDDVEVSFDEASLEFSAHVGRKEIGELGLSTAGGFYVEDGDLLVTGAALWAG